MSLPCALPLYRAIVYQKAALRSLNSPHLLGISGTFGGCEGNIPPHPWKILFGHRQRPHIGCMCGLQSAKTGGFILFGGSRQAAHGSCASHDEALRHIRFDIMALSHISCVNIKHFGFYTGFRVYTKSGMGLHHFDANNVKSAAD